MMKSRFKRRLLSLASFFILAFLVIANHSLAEENQLIAESHAVGLKYDLAIWHVETCKDNSKLREIVANSVLRKLLIIQASSPRIEDLNGEALENLCKLSNNVAILSYASVDLPKALGVNYLDSIESTVKMRIGELQKTMLGSGCDIAP